MSRWSGWALGRNGLLLLALAIPVFGEGSSSSPLVGLAAGNRLALGHDGRDPSKFSLLLTERARSGEVLEHHHNLLVLQVAYSGKAVPARDLGPLRFLRKEKGVFWFTDDCGGIWREDLPAKGSEARVRPVHVGYVFNGADCQLIKNESDLAAVLKETLPPAPGETPLSVKQVLALSAPAEELRQRVQKGTLGTSRKQAIRQKARIPAEVPQPVNKTTQP